MKIKNILIIFLIIFISQNTFASYSDTDTLKTIVLSKKNNSNKKVEINVGDKVFIVKGNTKKRGQVTNITDNGLKINNNEYFFEEIKIIGVKYEQKTFKILKNTIYVLSSTTAILLAILYTYNINAVLLLLLFLFLILLILLILLTTTFFLLLFFRNIFFKKPYSLQKWNLKTKNKTMLR